MNRPEARELQYFVAVAEELHFGRAAERLGIEQPPLSRAISRLERHLGVRLLERTTRSVALTPAGSVLLEESRVALDAIDAATRRAQRAGAEEAVLPVALKSEGDASLLRLVLSAYEREDDAIPIEVVMATWGQEAAMLRDGRAEVALLRTPFDERGLDYEKLLTEPRLVSMHADHRLASRRRLRLADLRDEVRPSWVGVDGASTAYWAGRDGEANAESRKTGAPLGPVVSDIGQVLRVVELGQAIAFVPRSIAERYPWPGIVYRPVADLSSSTVVVAWSKSSRSLAVAAFVRAATSLARSDPELVIALG
jgi:DNA-binding transcriptional LysR family regulator